MHSRHNQSERKFCKQENEQQERVPHSADNGTVLYYGNHPKLPSTKNAYGTVPSKHANPNLDTRRQAILVEEYFFYQQPQCYFWSSTTTRLSAQSEATFCKNTRPSSTLNSYSILVIAAAFHSCLFPIAFVFFLLIYMRYVQQRQSVSDTPRSLW